MMTLRHKLWAGFGGLLAVLMAVSILTAVVLTRYSKTLERVFRENYDSAVYCDSMKAALDQLNLRTQLTLWHRTDNQSIDLTAQLGKFEWNLAHQLANCTLPGEADHTYRLADLWKQYRAALTGFYAADDGTDIYRSTLLPLYTQMKQTAQWIADANMSNMVSVDGQAKKTLVEVRDTLLVLVITGAALAAGLVWAVGAAMLHPLTELTRSAREIEAGNLDLHVPVKSRDEIGQLAEAFNSMSVKLGEFRRLDHDRLVRTQQTTQLAIDSLPDAVFIAGPDGRVEISNRTARTHFGIEPGLTIESLDAKLKWIMPLYMTAHDGKMPPEPREYRSAVQLFENGEERYLLPRAVPMKRSDGTPMGVAFILVDVTRLRAADEAKSGVASLVSHELRTPLTAVRMALSLLIGGKFGSFTEKQSTLLTAAREDSDRLYRIVENLMSMSRIESGRVEFHFSPMRPAEIVAQSVDVMRGAFSDKRITLNLDVSDDLPAVAADPNVIGSALSNLLSNALKFTPPGGRVSVSAAAELAAVSFTVSDSGPGIPPQYAARIFDKFFRIPRPDGPSGSGLGLAIAKEIVEVHGGTLELCAGNGVGSTFRFTIPQLAAHSAGTT
jgi:two-component system, NtrC family, sensor histidine kinase KinB